MYQYNDNQLPEDGNTVNSQNIMHIKYTSDNEMHPKYVPIKKYINLY